MSTNKLIAFCLDAFDMQLADDLIAQGRLLGLKKLHDRSARFSLEHGPGGKDRYTGLTWEHFTSGKSPTGAGKWSVISFDPNEYSARQHMATERPFLASSGVRCVVFDAPYFDLQQMPDAQGVVGWSGHDTGVERFSRPAGLVDEIEEKFGASADKMMLNTAVYPSVADTKRLGKTLVELIERRRDITEWLLTERIQDWDAAIIGIAESHDAIELLCHGIIEKHALAGAETAPAAREALIATYEAISDTLDSLLDAFPDADFVTFSMHGMGWNDTDLPTMLLLPEFMYQLQFRKPFFSPRQDWITKPVPMLNAGEHWSTAVIQQMPSTRPSLMKRAVRKAGRIAGFSNDAETSIKTNISWMPSWQYQPYWKRMNAFALPAYFDGRIRINLMGRERHGTVAQEDYEKEMDRIESELRACVDTRTGLPIVKEISRPAKGDPFSLSPTQSDMHIIWNESPVGFRHPDLGDIGPAPIRRVGGHSGGLGRMYITSQDTLPGDFGQHSSFDVAPTIMAMLHLVRPNDMAGVSVLESVTH